MFLYIGRISLWQKADLLGLISCFCGEFHSKDAVLVVAGGVSDRFSNPDLKDIYALTSELGAGGRKVKIMPNITESVKATLYSAVDVFVSPSNSLQETFGLTVIEAMSYQLPVIATDWSGYSETIVDGDSGFLIPIHVSRADFGPSEVGERDRIFSSVARTRIDWAKFAEAMRTLFGSRELRLRMGYQGLRRVRECYSLRRMVQEFAKTWVGSNEARTTSIEQCGVRVPTLDMLLRIARHDV
jgi:glycosyltransferase involved in cell wall biosynthesis